MRVLLVAALATLAGCSSEPRPTGPSPQPQGQASADLRLNALKSGTFDCGGGLFFVASVLNQTPAPIQVDSLSLQFTKVSGTVCLNHAAPISSSVGLSVTPGVSTEIRRVDLAGDLCGPPNGEPGCEWLGKVSIATSFGTLTDEIAFRTKPSEAAPAPNPGPALTCPAGRPTIVSPVDGATLSGSVRVEAFVTSDQECPHTVGSIYRIYDPGSRLIVERFIRLFDGYQWDTTQVANGRFRITARKSCDGRPCGVTTAPIEVRVSN